MSYVIILTLFPYCLPFCYPYILNCFLLFMSFFSRRCMPQVRFANTEQLEFCPHRQHIWTIDSGISYADTIG